MAEPTTLRNSAAAALVVALLLAGCGGGGHARQGPALARSDAARLAALSDRLAAEAGDGCAYRRDVVRLRAETTRLINARRVPTPLLEPLSSSVNNLASRGPLCVPAPTVVPVPSPSSNKETHRKHGKGHGNQDGENGD